MIVEDNKMSLHLLSSIISSYFKEFSPIVEFTNATDALQHLKTNKVDIILTDIKMPGLSGIDLAGICHKHYPQIKIILISAYRDFEYAQKALNYNVINYILKPISADDLCRVLSSIDVKASAITPRFHNELLILNRQCFFSKLLSDKKVSYDKLSHTLSNLHIYVDYKKCFIRFYKMKLNNFSDYLSKTWLYGRDKLYHAINNIFSTSETTLRYIVIMPNDYDILDFLYLSNDSDPLSLQSFLHEIKLSLFSILKLDVTFEFIKEFKGIEQLNEFTPIHYYLSEQINSIFDLLSNFKNDDNLIREYISNTLEILNNDTSLLRNFSECLVTHALNYMGLEVLNTDSFNPYAYEYYTSPDEYQLFLKAIIKKILDYKNRIAYDNIIEKSIEYINLNFNKDITLESVANYVSQSPTYFSKYFKKITGEKFIDYVNKIKMQKAIRFLQDNPNIKITALMQSVGYQSSSNFYRNFKRFTGLTPIEYKQSHSVKKASSDDL